MAERSAANEADQTVKKTSFYDEFLEWAETVIFAFFAVILLFTFLLRQANVDGESMMPTLLDKEKLIVHHLFYKPERGDIVIINSEGLGKPIVKRVIAVGGDTVDIDFDTGVVKVNGEELHEDYILDLTKRDEYGHVYPVEVKEGCYFVMGDNRMNSLDSRSAAVGFVTEEEIMGKVIFRIWPINRIGVIE
ncbi:MAG: signal peptidase I [Huintestinicola sp.]